MRKTFTLIAAGLFFSYSTSAQTKIPVKEAPKHFGETVTICSKVYGSRTVENGQSKPTLLDCGAAFPNQQLVIAINTAKVADSYVGKNVCVTGKLVDHKGTPEIFISKQDEIHVQPVMGGGDTEIKTKDFFWFE